MCMCVCVFIFSANDGDPISILGLVEIFSITFFFTITWHISKRDAATFYTHIPLLMCIVTFFQHTRT